MLFAFLLLCCAFSLKDGRRVRSHLQSLMNSSGNGEAELTKEVWPVVLLTAESQLSNNLPLSIDLGPLDLPGDLMIVVDPPH